MSAIAMRAFALALASVLLVPAARAADVPYLTGRVVDNANILSAGAKQKIAQLSEAREKATGDQIAVLTMPSLEGESIEGYATRVFDAWKLGQKGKDNGVLVIVAPSDRKMRIEVGYGLEGTLTDATSSRIIPRPAVPPSCAVAPRSATSKGNPTFSCRRTSQPAPSTMRWNERRVKKRTWPRSRIPRAS